MGESRHPYQDVVARAWSDPAFKRRLLDDPKAVLREAGLDDGFGGEVRVVENRPDLVHLVLPERPALSEAQLDAVAGGGSPQGAAMSWQGIPKSPYDQPYPYPAPYPYQMPVPFPGPSPMPPGLAPDGGEQI